MAVDRVKSIIPTADGKFHARVSDGNGRIKDLGYFDTRADAIEAIAEAIQQ